MIVSIGQEHYKTNPAINTQKKKKKSVYKSVSISFYEFELKLP